MSRTTSGAHDAARRTVKQNSTREDKFLASLLAGEGITGACITAGISRSTGLRLRKTAEFQATLSEARSELLTGAISSLHRHASEFVATLHSIAADSSARGSDRVLAARHGLDLLLRGVETMELAERIAKLEHAAAEGQK